MFRYIKLTTSLGLIWVLCSPQPTDAMVEAPQSNAEQGVNEELPVASPLVKGTANLGAASLNSLAYKPTHGLYPARIISINDYQIRPRIDGYQYQLMSGQYVIEISPDFSLLSDIKPFMNQTYSAKKIVIELSANKQYSIGVRIDIDAPQQWQPQILELQAVAE